MAVDSWEALKSECARRRACSLCERRHNLVFGVGNERAELMLIGEGPGEQEDLKGEPFVGPAGKLLDDMLKMIDLDRSMVYIANIVNASAASRPRRSSTRTFASRASTVSGTISTAAVSWRPITPRPCCAM